MPLLDRLSHPPVGIGVILALAFLTLVIENQQGGAEGSKPSAKQELQDASDGGGATKVRRIVVPQRPPRNPNPDRDEWRQEQDLDAQTRMASWTIVVGVMAIAGVVVTGVGVWYVKKTLDATKGMLQEASNSTKAAMTAAEAAQEGSRISLEELRLSRFANRPYITISNFMTERVREPAPDGSGHKTVAFFVNPHVKNAGPARRL